MENYTINIKKRGLNLKAYKMLDIPDKIDLSIIAIPKEFVAKSLDDLGKKKTK
jgi:acyl-CoA synthetase (NDP forming)